MGRIHLLGQDIANKIAAGEVIERPASAVKELIENSLDAGADRIDVEIVAGGKEYIAVLDNGMGMNRDDLTLAIQRHATSKIKNERDLTSIKTLGFRGEALPSICAVAKVEIISKEMGDYAGSKLNICNDKIIVSDYPSPQGTNITVQDLFYNMPARKKFLKSDTYETGQIIDIVTKIAISYPNVAFRLVSNGREILRTTGSGNQLYVLAEIYGRELTKKLLPVEYQFAEFKLKGYIGRPEVSRSNRNYQYFCVNGRYIKSKALLKALENAYHTLMPVNRYPFAALNVICPHDKVDVNVHPAKIEVKFQDDNEVYRLVYQGVKQTLECEQIVPIFSIQSPSAETNYIDRQEILLSPNISSENIENNGIFAEEIALEYKGKNIISDNIISKEILPVLRPIGSIFKTYILAEGEDALYIIDQHAAHERVLYEKYMGGRAKHATQYLAIPLILELSPAEKQVIERCQEQLSDIGFTVEAFGDDAYIVRGIPNYLNDCDIESTIKDVINLFKEKNEVLSIEQLREKANIMMACKGAIKAMDELNTEEMISLLNQLMETKNPYTCPHGRPVLLKITKRQFEKHFKRV
jgi:DNA mismatch repair protein MutL